MNLAAAKPDQRVLAMKTYHSASSKKSRLTYHNGNCAAIKKTKTASWWNLRKTSTVVSLGCNDKARHRRTITTGAAITTVTRNTKQQAMPDELAVCCSNNRSLSSNKLDAKYTYRLAMTTHLKWIWHWDANSANISSHLSYHSRYRSIQFNSCFISSYFSASFHFHFSDLRCRYAASWFYFFFISYLRNHYHYSTLCLIEYCCSQLRSRLLCLSLGCRSTQSLSYFCSDFNLMASYFIIL